MTRYPSRIDSRNAVDAGFNENLRGYTNQKDRVYAEHVNALTDAVMSIERILGVNPNLNRNGIDNAESTVSGRIKEVERSDRLDGRYGGAGWNPQQNLVGHTHRGVAGGPSQINLVNEVKGLLNKKNIDLNTLTSTDIKVSQQDSSTIESALTDKLSVSQGGQIKKNVHVEGKLTNRTMREFDYEDRYGGSLISTTETMTGKATRLSGTGQTYYLYHEQLTGMQQGKYVLGVRMKTSSLANSNQVVLFVQNDKGSGRVTTATKYIKGSDFESANKYQMVYLVFDIDTHRDRPARIFIRKENTSISINIDIDHAFIHPVHPAVFDM